MSRAVVLGIGHLQRGDDAAGRLAARALAGRVPPGVDVRECRGDATELLEAWHDAPVAIVIDCVVSGAPPGTLHRVDAREQPLPSLPATSTHGYGLAQAVALARLLDALPPQLIVHGVEGARFAHGTEPGPEVRDAVGRVVDEIVRELEAVA